MKKLISVIMAIILTVASLTAVPVLASDQSYADELKKKGFPDTYVSYLVNLHKKYPKWDFVPFITNLDFQTAVKGERSYHSKQLIQKQSSLSSSYYCKCSACYKNGSYVAQEGKSWISASENAVKYYMDPRNWLNERNIFQFESTSYDSRQTQSGVESILKGTWMHDSLIHYKTTSGTDKTYNTTTKYSDAILAAAKNSGMSAYYLASKIRQENGAVSATNTAVKGTQSPFQGIYNYYNIGANAGAKDGLAWGAGFLKLNKDTTLYSSYNSGTKKVGGTKKSIKSGQYMTWRANCGDYFRVRLYTQNGANSYTEGASGYVLKSACRTTYFNYGRPWTNPYKAIYYGAEYIANSFSAYQNTGYLQKFNVNSKSNQLYNHEYMANVQAAAAEAVSSYNAYNKAGILASSKVFYIPVFKNMPKENCSVSGTSSTAIDPSTSTKPVSVSVAKPTGFAVQTRAADYLTLKWNKVSGASGYEIQKFENSRWSLVKRITSGSTLSYKISNLSAGGTYKCKIRAYKTVSSKTYYSLYTDTLITCTYPQVVTISGLSALSDHRIKVSWKKVSGTATGYQIYWARDKNFKNIVAKTTVNGQNTTSYIGKNFTKGITYYIKVRAYRTVSGTKYGSWSQIKSVKSK